MNNTETHQQLVDDLVFHFGKRRDVRCWPRVVGVGRALHSENVISFGIIGETDIQGIVKPKGRMLAIEAKTGSGELSARQEKWRDMILTFGGIWILAHAVTQDDIERAVIVSLSELDAQL